MTATLNPPNGSAPQGPSRSRTVWTIAVAVVGVLVVTAFGLLIARGSGMTAADLAVVTSLNQLHVGVLGFLTTAVYSAFSPVPAIAITAVAAAAIWLVSRRLLTAVTFAIVVAFTWLPSALVKAAVHRPRPDVHQLAHPFAIQPSDASYPSGHEVFIATVVVVAFLMSRGVLARILIGAFGAVAILFVGFALVSDGVHYPTDVAASVLWTLTVARAIMLLWRSFVVPELERRVAGRRRVTP